MSSNDFKVESDDINVIFSHFLLQYLLWFNFIEAICVLHGARFSNSPLQYTFTKRVKNKTRQISVLIMIISRFRWFSLVLNVYNGIKKQVHVKRKHFISSTSHSLLHLFYGSLFFFAHQTVCVQFLCYTVFIVMKIRVTTS